MKSLVLFFISTLLMFTLELIVPWEDLGWTQRNSANAFVGQINLNCSRLQEIEDRASAIQKNLKLERRLSHIAERTGTWAKNLMKDSLCSSNSLRTNQIRRDACQNTSQVLEELKELNQSFSDQHRLQAENPKWSKQIERGKLLQFHACQVNFELDCSKSCEYL